MLRWICANIMTDYIRNVTFRRFLSLSLRKQGRDVYAGMDVSGANVTQHRLGESNTYRFGTREREVGPVGHGQAVKFGHGSLKSHR